MANSSFEDLTLDALIEFEQDVAMKAHPHHLKSQPEETFEKLPANVVPLNSKILKGISQNASFEGKRYFGYYQGYETWPFHDHVLSHLSKMGETYPYSYFIKFGHLSLTHNDPLPGYHDEEALVLLDLQQQTHEILHLSSDLDAYEIDQWLRSKILEIMFEHDVDL